MRAWSSVGSRLLRSRRVRRIPLPQVLADVVSDVGARSALIAGSTALFAAGLDPKILGPAIPSVQAAIRQRPEIETLVLVVAVAWSGMLLLGGAIGDTQRVRPILLGALVAEALAAAIGLAFSDGPLLLGSRLCGSIAAALIIPIALASVATSYHGAARATAIGLAYGAYGAAGALGPILLQVIPGERWPAFAAAIVACGLAFWIARPRVPDLPRPSTTERPYVVTTAVWGFGIVMVTTGAIWFGGLDNPVRWALIVAGVAVLGLAAGYERRRRRAHQPSVAIERRPIAIAIFVGVVIAVAQTVPMLQACRSTSSWSCATGRSGASWPWRRCSGRSSWPDRSPASSLRACPRGRSSGGAWSPSGPAISRSRSSHSRARATSASSFRACSSAPAS